MAIQGQRVSQGGTGGAGGAGEVTWFADIDLTSVNSIYIHLGAKGNGGGGGDRYRGSGGWSKSGAPGTDVLYSVIHEGKKKQGA